ncbi:TRAP transporter substrate-binding protein [Brevibacillus nitrificans]|uniref:TRAP transporter substrate-binding protein n=1 Tax=Brevibacillus nitrificans TaxID=651560 RepID=UPI00286276D9|nr:TRAP transporter substrate-binding protein [Brevibacillus nitrificans]MDR7314728.1 tripartite ATP-independent transporter DctP family solute receptor [Brevibacillus nitrificans]
MKKFVIFSVLSCMLALVGCSSQSSSPSGAGAGGQGKAEQKVMKLAVVTAQDRSLTKGLIKFGEILEKESGGAFKVEVYADGKLGGDRAVFDAMKVGTIQGSTMSSGPIAVDVKRFTALDLPFLFKDEKTAYEILDGPIGKELLDELPAAGVVGLNYWENGFRNLTNNKREVKSIDDIKGLKIRTLENELHLDMWKEMGATPTPMAFTELFTALEQHVVDGQENPAGNVTSSKFYEVQKYYTKTGHVYNASPFLISKKFWDTLSDQEKEMVKKAAEEAKNYQRQLNQEETKQAEEFLSKNGMTVTELSPAEKQRFFDAMKPIYDKYSAQLGQDLVNKLREANK